MDGWRCPGCGRCYAPFVSECRVCNRDHGTPATTTAIAPREQPSAPPAHRWGEATPTAPQYEGDTAEMELAASPVLQEWAEHEASTRRLSAELAHYADRVTSWES